MATVRELITKFGFEVDQSKIAGVNRAVGQIQGKLEGATGNLKRFADGITAAGTKLTAFATLPIVALGAVSVKAASDAEETRSKFNTVFSDIGDSAGEAAQNLRDNFGLARSSAEQLLGDTGDLLTGFGFTQESALDLSNQVNQLAVDLASFTNFSGGARGASAALTKALLGERESVKSLGIAILEKDVKDRVALLRSKGMRFATERQAKAYATLLIAQEQSKNAIGDFARTQDSTANRMKVFRERLKEVGEQFGAVLLPVVNKALALLTKLLDVISRLSDTQKRWLVIIAAAVAAIGPLLLAVGSALKLFILFKTTMLLVSPAMAVLFGKFLLIAGVIAAVVAILGLLIEDFIVWKEGGNSAIGAVLGDFETFSKTIKIIVSDIKKFFVDLWEFIIIGFPYTLKEIGKTFVEWGKNILDIFLKPFRKAKEIIDKLFRRNRQNIPVSSIDSALRSGQLTSDNTALQSFIRPSVTNNQGGNNTIETNVEINATLPPGSTEQQARELERLTVGNMRGSLDREARYILQANPVVE